MPEEPEEKYARMKAAGLLGKDRPYFALYVSGPMGYSDVKGLCDMLLKACARTSENPALSGTKQVITRDN